MRCLRSLLGLPPERELEAERWERIEAEPREQDRMAVAL
jgi:hypothetical protein